MQEELLEGERWWKRREFEGLAVMVAVELSQEVAGCVRRTGRDLWGGQGWGKGSKASLECVV
jgi:hypothetical protein